MPYRRFQARPPRPRDSRKRIHQIREELRAARFKLGNLEEGDPQAAQLSEQILTLHREREKLRTH